MRGSMAFNLALIGLAIAMATVVAIAFRRATARSGPAAFGIAAWLAVTAAVAGAGGWSFATRPPTMLLLLAAILAGTATIAFSPLGARLATLPIHLLVGFQSFRVLVELWLHWGFAEGLFPVEMTYAGWNFDIVAGGSALVVGFLLARNLVGRRALWAWNIAGLGLLLNIVTIAVLSAPVPFRLFETNPPNTFVTGFPGVWLPAVLVAAALLGHLLVFRWLATNQPSHRPDRG